MSIQEVKAAAAEAVKDLAAHEKQQVGLEERSKHVKSKAKKLKKSVEEVNRHLSNSIIIWLRVASRTRKPKLQLFVQSKRAQAKSRKRKLSWRN